VGLDKLRYMPLVFDGDSLAAMRAVRQVFDPHEQVNPGKVIPIHACREWSGWSRSKPTDPGRKPGVAVPA
jgi:glycolate oxidase